MDLAKNVKEDDVHGLRFCNLNVAQTFIIKIAPDIADDIFNHDKWFFIRGKVSKHIVENPIVLIVAGKYPKPGKTVPSEIKGRMLGFCEIQVLRDNKMLEFCVLNQIPSPKVDQKILLIKTKAWFPQPIHFSRFGNNGYLQSMSSIQFPNFVLRDIIMQFEKVCFN